MRQEIKDILDKVHSIVSSSNLISELTKKKFTATHNFFVINYKKNILSIDEVLEFMNNQKNETSKNLYYYLERYVGFIVQYIDTGDIMVKNIPQENTLIGNHNFIFNEYLSSIKDLKEKRYKYKQVEVKKFIFNLQEKDIKIQNIDFKILNNYIEEENLFKKTNNKLYRRIYIAEFLDFCFNSSFTKNYSLSYIFRACNIDFIDIVNKSIIIKQESLTSVKISPNHQKYVKEYINDNYKKLVLTKWFISSCKTFMKDLIYFLEYCNLNYNLNSYTLFIELKKAKKIINQERKTKFVSFLFQKYYLSSSIIIDDEFASFPEWSVNSIKSYISYRRRINCVSSTITMDKNAIKRFTLFLKTKNQISYNDITGKHIIEFTLTDKHETIESKNAYLIRIKNFFKYLYVENFISTPLYLQFQTSRRKDSKIKSILLDEHRKVIFESSEKFQTELEKRSFSIVVLALQTGLRATDISKLRTNNVSFTSKSIKLMQIKTLKYIEMPLSNLTLNALFQYTKIKKIKCEYIFTSLYVPYEKISRFVISESFSIVCNKLSITLNSYSFHQLRRTYATSLLKRNLNITDVAYALGHSTKYTVSTYISLDYKRMKECILDSELLDYRGDLYD